MKTINPTKEEIKEIFNTVHNVWLKKYWDAKTDEDFQNLIKESEMIRRKYPFKITETLLLELSSIIDKKFRTENSHE